MVVRQCQKRMPDGRLCRAAPLQGEDFCLFHHPDRVEDAAEIRRLGGLRRKREGTVAGAYGFAGLASVPDIQRLLDIASLDTLALDNSVARNRTLAYLAQTGLKALEVGALEERVAQLEGALRHREPSPTADFDIEIEVEEDQERKELNP